MLEVDPTRVEMTSDPRVRRFTGIAVHGNTPFDVPYISQITEDLYQGGCETGLVLPNEIEHLISLYPWEKYTVPHTLQSRMEVRLYDDLKGPDREQMIALASWINVCRSSGPTLVHCQAGLNRSGLLAGLALVLEGHEPRWVVDEMRARRSPAVLCNPVFERWLLDFEL